MPTNPKRPWPRRLVPLIVAAVLLGLAHLWLDPAPLSALTAVIGGLAGTWVRRRAGRVPAAEGIFAGAAAGAAIHLWLHGSGRSPAPLEGVAWHVAREGAVGLVIASAIVGIGWLVAGLLDRGARPSR